MRITQSMINENFTRNLMRNLKRLGDTNDMISSRKKIRRPSDDPVGTAMAMKLRRQLVAVQQYNSNAQDALTWMKNTEAAFSNTGDILHRLSELTVQAANAPLSSDERQKILDEVVELKNQIYQEANSTSVDRYIFSGYSTNKPPFIKEEDKVKINPEIESSLNATDGAIEYNLNKSEHITINLIGPEVFEDIFKAVEALEEALQDNNIDDLSGPILEDIKNSMGIVLKYRSQIGARSNRLEATVLRLDANEVDYMDLLSKTEDIDLARMITELKMDESVYRASLAVGARIILPSLVDFLR